MIWIMTLAYCLFCSLVLWLSFEVYARTLKAIGTLNNFVKIPSAMVIYVVFSCLIVGLLLVGFGILKLTDRNSENTLLHILYLSFYAVALVPGFLWFKKVHLGALSNLGFFVGKDMAGK